MTLLSSPRVRVLATVTVLATGLAFTTAATRARHAELKKSWPAANDSLAKAPDSLKLWFSEKVELPLTKIQLMMGGTMQHQLGAPAFLGATADAPVTLVIVDKLSAGKFTVNWTVAGKDGHPSKGTYDFVVKAGK